MECSIYDIDLNRIAVISTWVSLYWEETYNASGTFQLEVQQASVAPDLLLPDRYCKLSESNTMMIIKAVQVINSKIIASGYPITQILDDRVSTKVISNQNAEIAMRSVVAEMSSWPNLELGELSNIDDVFSAQKSDASVLEYCQIIGQATDIGFRIRHASKAKKLLFECYKPEENKNAKYSTMYGNLTGLEYSKSTASLKNVAIVAGGGEGKSRITVEAGKTELHGADRREMYVDARNLQQEEGESYEEYLQRLIRSGEEKLVGQISIENFKFEIDPQDVQVGDIVTCIIPELNVKLKARVVGITRTSQQNTETVEASIGNPIIIRRDSTWRL